MATLIKSGIGELMDKGHWDYDEPLDVDKWFGFIYCITNLENKRCYIGRKQFHYYLKKKVKGRKNRKHTKVNSNWKTYTGSNKKLNEHIEEQGIENFKFEILTLHTTRGSLHYAEVETLVKKDTLRKTLKDGTRKYYNRSIPSVKFIPPDKQ